MSERLTSKSGIRDSLHISHPEGFGRLHSEKAYSRFFEGFVEETVSKGNRQKIVRVYVGDYYVPECSNKNWIGVKLINTLLLLMATILFVFAATRNVELNRVSSAYFLTMIPQPVCVIFLLWSLVTLVNFWMAPAKMTVGEYRRGPGTLKTAVKCYSLALALAAVGAFVQLLYCTTAGAKTVFLSVMSFLLAALLAFLLYRVEERRSYYKQDNPQKTLKEET